MSDLGKSILKVVLAILFLPITLTILVFKSDMEVKGKLISVVLIWGITIAAASFTSNSSGSNDTSREKTKVSAEEDSNKRTAKNDTKESSQKEQDEEQIQRTVVSDASDIDKSIDAECGIDHPRPVSDVKKGSPSEDVLWLQSALNKAVGLSLAVDGDYGKATTSAVKKFQKTYDLDSSGIADKETIQVLSDVLSGKREPGFTPTPTPVVTHTYVLNVKTYKFHETYCRDVRKMNDENKYYFEGTREEVIANGYDPCGHCNP